MKFYQAEQGTDEWLEARRGVITGSRFRDAREKTAKGLLGAKAILYAMDTARERIGGTPEPVYVNSAMRTGTEQEPMARQAYEARTGNIVDAAGFITTDDDLFGVSVDGLVDDDGMVEIKTMVSSKTLFTAVIDGDHSDYIDQINGSLWLLGRKWCDLILWAPDLPPPGRLTIVRINRDDNAIQKLEDDLIAFEKLVSEYERKLYAKVYGTNAKREWCDEGADTFPPAPAETVDREDALASAPGMTAARITRGIVALSEMTFGPEFVGGNRP